MDIKDGVAQTNVTPNRASERHVGTTTVLGENLLSSSTDEYKQQETVPELAIVKQNKSKATEEIVKGAKEMGLLTDVQLSHELNYLEPAHHSAEGQQSKQENKAKENVTLSPKLQGVNIDFRYLLVMTMLIFFLHFRILLK